MAWMPGQLLDYGPKGYETFDVLDESSELLGQLREQVETQYAHLDKYDLMCPVLLSGTQVFMQSGYRFPMPDRPFIIRMDRKTNSLRDITSAGVSLGITQKVINCIESIEPGVHQYLPLEILQPDGSPYPVQYWLLNICHRVDSIALEHSENLYPRYWPGTNIVGNYGHGDFHDTKYTLWKSQISGKALWWEAKIGLGTICISDALKEALDAASVTGWKFDEFGTPTYLYEV